VRRDLCGRSFVQRAISFPCRPVPDPGTIRWAGGRVHARSQAPQRSSVGYPPLSRGSSTHLRLAGGLVFFCCGQGPPELFLWERLLASDHRTLDPNQADFFFVPTLARPAVGGFAGATGRWHQGNYWQVLAPTHQNCWEGS
jgi:hypothetical protein